MDEIRQAQSALDRFQKVLDKNLDEGKEDNFKLLTTPVLLKTHS